MIIHGPEAASHYHRIIAYRDEMAWFVVNHVHDEQMLNCVGPYPKCQVIIDAPNRDVWIWETFQWLKDKS